MSEDEQVRTIVAQDSVFGRRITGIETVEDVLHATLDGDQELTVQWHEDSDAGTMAQSLIAEAKRKSIY